MKLTLRQKVLYTAASRLLGKEPDPSWYENQHDYSNQKKANEKARNLAREKARLRKLDRRCKGSLKENPLLKTRG